MSVSICLPYVRTVFSIYSANRKLIMLAGNIGVSLVHIFIFILQVSINLGLVYKIQQHNGIIFQFIAYIKRRQRTVPEILAAGGRYDHLVCTHIF